MWKSLILAIMGEKSNLMHILYNTENFFLSPYLIKIVGKSRFLSKQKRVLLYLWDIMNKIMLRFDIKMRKIYVHSPFKESFFVFSQLLFSYFQPQAILKIRRIATLRGVATNGTIPINHFWFNCFIFT